jgi:hypothetical protein
VFIRDEGEQLQQHEQPEEAYQQTVQYQEHLLITGAFFPD